MDRTLLRTTVGDQCSMLRTISQPEFVSHSGNRPHNGIPCLSDLPSTTQRKMAAIRQVESPETRLRLIAARPNPGQFSFSGRGVGRTHKDYRSNGRSTLVLAVRSSLLSSPECITSCRRTWSDIHRFRNSLQPSSMLQRSETRRIKKRKEMLLLASLMSLKTPDTWVLLGSSLCTLFRVLGCLGMDVHVVQTIFSIRFFL